MAARKMERLGDILINRGIITQEQLEDALAVQKEKKMFLGETLVEMGLVDQKKIDDTLCEHLKIDYVDVRVIEPLEEAFTLLDEKFMRDKSLIIFDYGDGGDISKVKVAMSDPMNIFTIDDVEMITGKEVVTYLANAREILNYLDKRFGSNKAQDIAEEFGKTLVKDEAAEEEAKARQEELENAPIVKLVNGIFEQAVRQRTSDIHIEPFEHKVRVRFRIDGSLVEHASYDMMLMPAITARLKIMSGMDIAEKRKPQDGRITTFVDRREYDIRVSNLPTVYGEKIVMRIASKEGFNKKITDLGFKESDMRKFNEILKHPHGIILVTGPTGSGKSTTLYTALSALNTDDVNIITVEDPVEANIDGINQVHVNAKAGLTFASALRSILRQDPDIIMIGEIRDGETAEIAVKASITGHLVVSTLHTNSTAATVSRMVDMGIEPYLLADSLVGIIAQRLAKRLCEDCKVGAPATDDEKRQLGIPKEKNFTIYKPCGCKKCNNTGYLGRIGIYEIMQITPNVKRIIAKGGDTEEIKKQSVIDGMHTLKHSVSQCVVDGVTSMEQMLKIAYET